VNPLASGSVITISHTSVTAARAAVVSVFRGLADSAVLDQTHTGTGSSTAPSSGATSTTTQADELLIGAAGVEGGNYDAPGAPGFWINSFTAGPRMGTGFGTTNASDTDITASMGWRIVATTGGYSATQSLNTSRDWAAAIATLKAATHDLTITVDPALSGTTSPTAGTHTYVEGTVVVITTTPTAGYLFDHWNGACSGAGTCLVTMSMAKAVTATFALVNEAPVITEGTSTSVSMSEDGSPTPFDLTLHATDANLGDTLTWSISTPASHGTASASGTGTSQVIAYTPTADYNGTDSFEVQVSDGHGGTDSITVNVIITPVNDAPLITEGTAVTVTMSEDGSPTPFNLTLNATDVDITDTLTWSISSPASHGTASASGTGTSKTIIYTPTVDYNGSDSFVVQVSDGHGGIDSITVNVIITPVNDAPVITEGTSTDVTMSKNGIPIPFDLTLHATDVDTDTLTWSVSTPASHGTASASGTGTSKAIVYTPTTNYTGTDSFVVQVSDGNGGTDTIVVNVTISEAPAITYLGDIGVANCPYHSDRGGRGWHHYRLCNGSRPEPGNNCDRFCREYLRTSRFGH
jgi:hypothetical protein